MEPDFPFHAGIPPQRADPRLFVEKFENLTFVDGWRDLPTSTNIDAFSARASAGLRRGRVLDLCCGTGKGSLPLVKSGAAREVVYVDRSPFALGVAEEVVQRLPSSYRLAYQLICQPAELIDTERLGSFDSIVIRYAFHLIAKPEVVLRRLYSMLAPGGRIVFNLAGSNIFRFSNPALNAVPTRTGIAHPFFKAMYHAACQLSRQIFDSAVILDGECMDSFWTPGHSSYQPGSKAEPGLRLEDIKRIVADAGIPHSHLSAELTWLRAAFEEKAGYALAFGSPPIPGLWDLFDRMPGDARRELAADVVRRARASLPASSRFYFPEPLFTIFR